MPGGKIHVHISRGKDQRKQEGKRVSCGYAGFWADNLEKIIAEEAEKKPEIADLHENLLMKEVFFIGSQSRVGDINAKNLHLALGGHVLNGDIDTNADRRLNAAAKTIEALENKEELLSKLQIDAHELRILTLAKAKEKSAFQVLKDIANFTGLFGKEAQVIAGNNLNGVYFLRKNAEYHQDASEEHDTNPKPLNIHVGKLQKQQIYS